MLTPQQRQEIKEIILSISRRISELPEASEFSTSDYLAIVQEERDQEPVVLDVRGVSATTLVSKKATLQSIVEYIKSETSSTGALFCGVANPTDSPVIPPLNNDGFWFAINPGTYTNYGGITVTDVPKVIYYDHNSGTWSSEDLWVSKGPKGDTGATGKSAYQSAVDNGYQGTEEQWVSSLKGEKGDKGDTGLQGPTGATGPAGADGRGVPTGGSAGQVLAKSSGSDYATEWVTPQSGSDLDALRDWTNYDGTDADQVLGSNLGKAMKDDIDAMLDGYIFKGVASTNTNPGTVTKKTAYLAGAGTYSNFTSGGSAITVPEGNIGVMTWNNGWSVSLLAVGSGGGGGINYQKVNSVEYDTMYQNNTLDPNKLYIIVDTTYVSIN